MEDRLCRDHRHVPRGLPAPCPHHRGNAILPGSSGGGAGECRQASLATTHMPERQEKLQATKDNF